MRIVARRDDTAKGRVLVAGAIATAFGCTISGAVSEKRVVAIAERMAKAGVDEIAIADTVGYANPAQVERLARAVVRAVGDVLRDQLSHMRQCGFDAFAVREDKSAEDALKGLAGLSVLYGRSVIEPNPLFRRR